jgi:formate transporter
MATDIQIDAFPPAKMASRMEEVGVSKANLRLDTTLALAILAGAFIGSGAIFATVVTTGLGSSGLGFGLIKLLGGLVFCLGLIAVVVAGAELFTGNNLIIMAYASRRIKLAALLRNWTIVYVGNFIGSIATALIMLVSKQYTFSNGALGANALGIAAGKCNLEFFQAVALGVMCNAFVCLAVWLCASARSTTDKILAILFPITAFVAAGFEHSVANMYFIPMGLLIKAFAGSGFWEAIGKTAADYSSLTWTAFFIKNLLPVTLGNVIGGSAFIGLAYWFIYLRPQKVVEVEAEKEVKILVVEDDPDFVMVIRSVLEKDGRYRVSTARNGDEALEAMRQSHPDLILLDIMMTTPLEGVSLAKQVSRDAALSKIPVIVISGIDESEYASLIPDDKVLPIDAWISKPIDPDHLLRTVQRFLA